MGSADDTSWSLVERAAGGEDGAREEFVRRYDPFVRSYLASRWKGSPQMADLDDAVQEVFLDCFRDGGVLERADPERSGGFRAFLCGVMRIVILRTETRRARERERAAGDPEAIDDVRDPRDTIGTSLDRAWARRLLSEAVARHRELSTLDGADRALRFRMLQMRFRENLTIAEVATAVDLDPDKAKRELAKARREFEEALLEVVAVHCPGDPGAVRREARRILTAIK